MPLSNDKIKQFQQVLANFKYEANRPSRCPLCGSSKAKKFIHKIFDPKDRFMPITCCSQCVDFVEGELQKIVSHRNLDKPIPQIDFLCLKSWLETLKHFQRQCAYCGRKPYQELDHFLPRILGGKTTVNNCLPSCKVCNGRKSGFHPKHLDAMFPATIAQLRVYLTSQKPCERPPMLSDKEISDLLG